MTTETIGYQQQELPTVEQIRAASEALKGVSRACDITRAKPEFVEFIRTCSPAAIISILNRLDSQSERMTTITAQRNRYWEQVEVLVEAANLLLAMDNCNYDRDQMRRSGGFDALRKAVAAVAEESEDEQ